MSDRAMPHTFKLAQRRKAKRDVRMRLKALRKAKKQAQEAMQREP